MRIKKLLRKELKFKISSNKNNIPIFDRNGGRVSYVQHTFRKIASISPVTFISQEEKRKEGEEKTSTS